MDDTSSSARARPRSSRCDPEVSRRVFLRAAGAAGMTGGALGLAGPAHAQPGKVTKETLRPLTDVAELAITDEQLGKIAGAMAWARGEFRKLREVETGLTGPAPAYLPPLRAEGESHE